MLENLKHTWKMAFDREYARFWDHKNGKRFITIKRGVGYYINTTMKNDMMGAFLNSPGLWDKTSVKEINERVDRELYQKVERIKMTSGKTAIIQLLSYKCFSDPYDMVQESYWKLIGYVGMKTIEECTWEEYRDSYLAFWNEKKIHVG